MNLVEQDVFAESQRVLENAELIVTAQQIDRSEERRVGKECRSRWWTDH